MNKLKTRKKPRIKSQFLTTWKKYQGMVVKFGGNKLELGNELVLQKCIGDRGLEWDLR